MKIIHGHDYYDGAGYGVDPEILLVRDLGELPAAPISLPLPIADLIHRGSAQPREWVTFFMVLFAGEAFPGARHHYDGANLMKSWILWEEDEIRETVSKIIRRKRKWSLYGRSLEQMDKFLAKRGEGPWTSWMIDHDLAIVTIQEQDVPPRRPRKRMPIALSNPSTLKELEFFRVMDPPTAHMRLQGWVGGVLSSNPDVVEISDQSKIQKAGFDLITSFRRAPGKRRR